MPRGIPNQAKNTPVLTSRTIDATQQDIGQGNTRVLRSTGPAEDALDAAEVIVVDRPVDNEKMAMLAFMEEPVTVHIHTTSDKAAEQIFEIFNNGQREVFRRGETKTVKRKFVNELAMRKLTVYENEEVRAPDGTKQYKYVPRTALRYPFSVTHDDHPRGADWLKVTLSMNG